MAQKTSVNPDGSITETFSDGSSMTMKNGDLSTAKYYDAHGTDISTQAQVSPVPGAPPPPVSAQNAGSIAGQQYLHQQQGVPYNQISFPQPDGTVRPLTASEANQSSQDSNEPLGGGGILGLGSPGDTIGKAVGAGAQSFGLGGLLSSLGVGAGGNSSGIVDAVNKVAGEAQTLAPQVRDFQLQGLGQANAAFNPALGQFAGMYGPGGTQTTEGQGEQAFDRAGASYLDPTAQSQVLGQVGGAMAGQGAGLAAFNTAGGALLGPSHSDQAYSGIMGSLGQSDAAGNFAAHGGQYNTNTLNDAYAGLNSQYAQPTQSGQTFQSQQGQLSGPGALEQFAASDLKGNNPYFQMLHDQQAADIDASMAARGGFNSGAAIYAQGKADAQLRAQQYAQEAGLQGAAETAQQARLGQNQAAASSADTQNYNRLSGQSGLAATTAATNLNYLQGQQNAANSSDAATLGRSNAAINLAQGTDTADTARTNAYLGAGTAAQNAQTNQYSQYGQLAQGADAAHQNQLNNYLNQAQNAQNATMNRQQQGVADATAIGNAQAGNTIQAYGNAGNQYTNMIDTSMGAQLNAAQLQAQQNAQSQQNTLGLLGLGVKAYGAFSGDPTALAAGAATGGGYGGYSNPGVQYGPNGAPILS